MIPIPIPVTGLTTYWIKFFKGWSFFSASFEELKKRSNCAFGRCSDARIFLVLDK